MSTPPTEPPGGGTASTLRAVQLGLSGLFGLLGVLVFLFAGEVSSVAGPLALTAAIVAALTAMTPRMGLLATALGGAGAAGYLFMHKISEDAAPSLCSVNAVFDCDTVNASAASEVLGVPISLFGLAFYLGVAAVTLFGARSTPRFHQALSWFGLASVAYSAWLAWQSHQLGLVCLFCMAMWAANLLLLVGGLRGLAEEGRRLTEGVGAVVQSRSAIVIAAVFLIVTAVGSSQLGAAGGIPEIPEDGDASDFEPRELARYYGRPNGTLQLDGTEAILGSPSAPYLVVEFADFRCGHCAAAARTLTQVVEENPEVQVRFKSFPLSGKCNPLLPDEESTWDVCLAAAAADCARQQGQFWPMAHTLFENPDYFQPEDLMFMAKQLSLDEAAFAACMNDESTLRGVVADAQAGIGVKIEGTPTLFLRLPGTPEFLQITHGVEALYYLIQAHKAGVELPPPAILPAPY